MQDSFSILLVLCSQIWLLALVQMHGMCAIEKDMVALDKNWFTFSATLPSKMARGIWKWYWIINRSMSLVSTPYLGEDNNEYIKTSLIV